MTSPDWVAALVGARDEETGAFVPLDTVVLFRDALSALTVSDFVAYSTSFRFTLTVLRRVDDVLKLVDTTPAARVGRGEMSEKIIRLQIDYADGRKTRMSIALTPTRRPTFAYRRAAEAAAGVPTTWTIGRGLCHRLAR